MGQPSRTAGAAGMARQVATRDAAGQQVADSWPPPTPGRVTLGVCRWPSALVMAHSRCGVVAAMKRGATAGAAAEGASGDCVMPAWPLLAAQQPLQPPPQPHSKQLTRPRPSFPSPPSTTPTLPHIRPPLPSPASSPLKLYAWHGQGMQACKRAALTRGVERILDIRHLPARSLRPAAHAQPRHAPLCALLQSSAVVHGFRKVCMS